MACNGAGSCAGLRAVSLLAYVLDSSESLLACAYVIPLHQSMNGAYMCGMRRAWRDVRCCCCRADIWASLVKGAQQVCV
jgi:hypothetical protein